MNWADHALEVEAPIETCFDAIVDYESFPSWQSSVISSEVLSRDRNGLGERVTLFLSAKGQKVDYTLDYDYDRPTEIRWDFVEGHGVKNVDGVYSFEDLGGDRTRIHYKLGIDPSLPVPGMVARRIHAQALKKSVEELRDEAERRHREGASERQKRRPSESERAPRAEPGMAEGTAGERESAEPEPALGAVTSLPGTAVDRAVSLGRGAAETGARAAGEIAGGMIGIAHGAARTGIGIGRELTGAVTGRISRLLGREHHRDWRG